MCEDAAQRDLIVRATGGDRFALEQLLLMHYARLARRIEPKLTGPLARVLGVEDVLQETFIRAMRDIERCAARSVRSFVAWTNALADHQLQDMVRGLRRQKRGGGWRQLDAAPGDQDDSAVDLVKLLSDHDFTPGRTAARREAVRAIQVGIAGLPAGQREAIRMCMLNGKSIDETAAAMQRSPAAVRGLVQRAKQSLRDALGRSTLWLSKK